VVWVTLAEEMVMQVLLLVALAGLGAQFVDGALGMGYGVTSSTLLIAMGLSPAVASASVQMSKIGTAAISGISHHKFGNVDWLTVRRIAIPGAVGSFFGALFLSSLSTEAARPVAAGLLFCLGLYVLLRFLIGRAPRRRPGTPGLRMLAPLGLAGGFIDATGGGGWGPVTTPTLLADGRLAPARVIGTVSTAEFLVATSATLGFFLGLGIHGVEIGYVIALLVGGAIAAPFAAAAVRHMNPRILGVVIGGVIVLLNARILLAAVSAPAALWITVYAVLLSTWLVGLALVLRVVLRERHQVPAESVHA
jgi:uncharacterized membrane protein YfcA